MQDTRAWYSSRRQIPTWSTLDSGGVLDGCVTRPVLTCHDVATGQACYLLLREYTDCGTIIRIGIILYIY